MRAGAPAGVPAGRGGKGGGTSASAPAAAPIRTAGGTAAAGLGRVAAAMDGDGRAGPAAMLLADRAGAGAGPMANTVPQRHFALRLGTAALSGGTVSTCPQLGQATCMVPLVGADCSAPRGAGRSYRGGV